MSVDWERSRAMPKLSARIFLAPTNVDVFQGWLEPERLVAVSIERTKVYFPSSFKWHFTLHVGPFSMFSSDKLFNTLYQLHSFSFTVIRIRYSLKLFFCIITTNKIKKKSEFWCSLDWSYGREAYCFKFHSTERHSNTLLCKCDCCPVRFNGIYWVKWAWSFSNL